MPDHLIVIRSADTDYETQGRVRGSLDIPPCSAGLAEANAVATRLAHSPPVALYAAPPACAAEAAGQAPLDPLRWFLMTMLGPLDAEDACPPSKRPCVVAASPEQMEQDAL